MISIKLCGITNISDARSAVECGADALGFNFYRKSKRYVLPERAREIIQRLPREIIKVGVFVNQEIEEVKGIARFCDLSLIQLHGDESPRYCSRFPISSLIKAVSPHTEEDVLKLRNYPVGAILVDAYEPGRYGGTGKISDWRLALKVRETHPLILAGGLNTENIREAVEAVRPQAVDINSGAEISPGRKDHDKIRRIIEIVRETDRREGPLQEYMNFFKRGHAELVSGSHRKVAKSKGEPMQRSLPDERGHFGIFGGKYVPETLMTPLKELEEAYLSAKKDILFQKELGTYLKDYAGRPTPLYLAKRLTEELRGPKIYLKREDLTHTGSHKINNSLGQAFLARKMGKKRIIAETGAGQHGVATATAAALLELKCTVYMGEEDIQRQSLNVLRMKLLGAQIIPVSSGSKTLKDAINEAIRDWVTHVRDTHYLIGSVVGPHPYPMMVRDFQSVIGKEAKKQILEKEGRLPDFLVACVGGGSNAIGLFHPFFKDGVRFIGVEAGGMGIPTGRHAASLYAGCPGTLHGAMSYLLQNGFGNIVETHSIAPGLDYPGVGPEHAYYKESGRAEYVTATDEEALDAFHLLSQTEGILPALESAHALAHARGIAPSLKRDRIMIINLSGRGDKDVQTVDPRTGVKR